MSRFIPADGGNTYDLGNVLRGAINGNKIVGYAGEITQEFAKRFGDAGVHVPLSAVCKATGASPIVSGAVPLAAFDIDSTIAEVDAAISKELIAGKIGVRMISTNAASYRVPYVDAKPTFTINDVDESIPDSSNSNFDYKEILPVQAGSLITVANSLDWTTPDAVQVISRQIVSVVREAVDQALLLGYGPTTSGRSFAGISAIATASGVTLSSASTVSQWADVVEAYSAYTETTDTTNTRWVLHPRTTDALLPISPMFAGSQTSIGLAGGMNVLLGHNVTKARLPVTTGAPDTVQTYFGEMGELVLAMFNSATISLVSNPYADSVFNKGATLLRVLISFGYGVRDGKKIVKATTQLP